MEAFLEKYLDHLAGLFDFRLREFSLPPGNEVPLASIAAEIPAVPAPDSEGHFGAFCTAHELTPTEVLLLCLTMLPEIQPARLFRIIEANDLSGKALPEVGGYPGDQHRGILPTGQTAVFLLAGPDTGAGLTIRQLLLGGSRLIRSGILILQPPVKGEPALSGRLTLEREWLEQVLTGRVGEPQFSAAFPAHRLETELTWEDLVLEEDTLHRLEEVNNYLKFAEGVDGRAGFGRYSRRGYRALFYGPPGTGKTLTALLLGKSHQRPVFRIDLSAVVSKYIGETEKNLAALLARAEYKDWILFFDEADALFSKRTEVKDSKDRYANQETSFLLQRIEQFGGLVILATNFRDNIDAAFSRRFETIIGFQKPGATQRLRLWQKMAPQKLPFAKDVDLVYLAERYELTGGSIANVIRQAVFSTLATQQAVINQEQLLRAIRLEFAKEGRMLPR